ncbi:unnamed protein product [Echinostoma caproni]|uniref:C3H1-type domain-containing protein n=1 Tax=Echinostoma caproni TaxID=27848 RepID=A0A183BD76_9TREM|nr:unnamed protein product [Echinostoma caproni]
MSSALAQFLVSIAERLFEESLGRPTTIKSVAKPKAELPLTGITTTESAVKPTPEDKQIHVDSSEQQNSTDSVPAANRSPPSPSTSTNRVPTTPRFELPTRQTPSESAASSSPSVYDQPVENASSANKENNNLKNHRVVMMTSVGTSPTHPRRGNPLFGDAVKIPTDPPDNLDWCRWPVCMSYYLHKTCPFGEASCPDAHASSDFDNVINEKGLVRVCFDALGVSGVSNFPMYIK